MANIYDTRSTVGSYLRGNNVYNGTASSPNPMGQNQYPKNLQAAARLRRRRRAAQSLSPKPPTNSNSLVTEVGGLYQ
jgi:hypothetical protein